MVIVPHYDAMVLTFKKKKLSFDMVNSSEKILYGFNGATTITLEDVALHIKIRASHPISFILDRRRLGALQFHNGTDLAAFDESYPIDLPPKDQLFD